MRRFMFPLLLGLVLSGCGWRVTPPDQAQESLQVLAMDTVMTFSVYGEHSTRCAYAAEDEMRRLESLLSRTEEDSAVSALNRGQSQLPAEVLSLLRAAKDCSALTGGAFDPTVAPIVSAWGFTEEVQRVPSKEEIEALLPLTGQDKLTLTESSASLAPGSQVDLGGIAKGYASDRVADLFLQYDVPRGWASLGGNVLTWGSRPDGTPWRIAIDNPDHPGQDPYAAILLLEDVYAVTSGGYQRYFEENGRIYSHIIDPATGYPAESGLTSVTVSAPVERDREAGTPGSGTVCDALSTALFIMGEEKALEFWRSGRVDFEAVLITEDGRVIATEGIADRLTEVGESGYRYETALRGGGTVSHEAP